MFGIARLAPQVQRRTDASQFDVQIWATGQQHNCVDDHKNTLCMRALPLWGTSTTETRTAQELCDCEGKASQSHILHKGEALMWKNNHKVTTYKRAITLVGESQQGHAEREHRLRAGKAQQEIHPTKEHFLRMKSMTEACMPCKNALLWRLHPINTRALTVRVNSESCSNPSTH